MGRWRHAWEQAMPEKGGGEIVSLERGRTEDRQQAGRMVCREKVQGRKRGT